MLLSMTAPSPIYVEYQVCLTFQVFWAVFQTKLFFLRIWTMLRHMTTLQIRIQYIWYCRNDNLIRSDVNCFQILTRSDLIEDKKIKSIISQNCLGNHPQSQYRFFFINQRRMNHDWQALANLPPSPAKEQELFLVLVFCICYQHPCSLHPHHKWSPDKIIT